MTPVILVTAISLGAIALLVVAFTRRRPPETVTLTYETAASRTRAGWKAFWARDPFIQAHKARTRFAFGQYIVPGGDVIATHLSGSDLRQHNLILGATGCGKSTLLEALARCHLEEDRPFALMDLHGDLFHRVAAWSLVWKARGLTILDFTKPELLPSWNPLVPMEGVDPGRQVDMLVGILKRLYADEALASWSWGVKAEELLRHALRACIESTEPITLAELPQFFLVPNVRETVLASVPAETRAYFTNPQTFGAREEQYVSAVLNKLEPFLGSKAVQRFLGRSEASIDLLGVLDREDTVLVNIPRGYLGTAADVMGRLIMNAFQLAALRRERIAPDRRLPYTLLLDEAQALAGKDSGLEEFLVAARKYKVYVTLAAQGLSLFPARTRPHLLGNTGGQFFFRLPYAEARMLAPDVLEPLGSVWREQIRPNDAIVDPLLTPDEEVAHRTREVASLPVGDCYWLTKGRPYKGRRIHLLKPLELPFSPTQLQKRIEAWMGQKTNDAKTEVEEGLTRSALAAAIAARSARRAAEAGIVDEDAQTA